MILLIDTNILLDVLQRRPGLHRDSSRVWNAVEGGGAHGYVSMISFNNIYYILRRQVGPASALEAVKLVRQLFRCVPFDEGLLENAIRLAVTADFEDAIQQAAATRVRADYLVTRNVADFTNMDGVAAIAPDEFLSLQQP